MLKRLPYLLHFALLAVLCIVLSGPSLAASPGVAVQWNYDATTKMLALHIQNICNKDITGYAISVTVKHSDGSADSSEMMDDFLPVLAGNRGTSGSFVAGTSLDKNIPQSKDVTNVLTVVDVVAYLDGTADVQNQRMLNHIVAVRKAYLYSVQQATQAISQALASPDPRTAAAGEIKRLADVAKAKSNGPSDDPTSYYEMFLRRQISETNNGDLAGLVKENEARIAVILPHTQLKAVKP